MPQTDLPPAEPIAADLPAPQAQPESSSLGRWLAVATLIVVLAGAATVLVRFLPTEDSRPGELPFAISTKPKGPPGKVVLTEETTYKFGVMPQQTKGEHTWVFKNDGQGDLELSKGVATCSCTIANFAEGKNSFTLKPGQQTEIKLTWETRDKDGKFEKSAEIKVLGDPDRESVVFAISGTVRPAIAVEPKERTIAFPAFANDETVTGKFAVASADHPDFKILSITSSRPSEMKITQGPIPDTTRKGLEWQSMPGGYLITVEMLPTKNLGAFNDDITVVTDHPLQKEFHLSVAGKRTGPIDVVPESVRLHNIQASDGASTTLMLLVRNRPDAKIAVASAPENVKVEVVPSDLKTGSAAKIRQYRMTVTVLPGAPAGVISGDIVLSTDHPQAAEVKIPVDVTVIGEQ